MGSGGTPTLWSPGNEAPELSRSAARLMRAAVRLSVGKSRRGAVAPATAFAGSNRCTVLAGYYPPSADVGGVELSSANRAISTG